VREQLYDIMQDVIVEKALDVFNGKNEEAATEFTTWARTTFPITLRPENVTDCFDNPEEAADKAFAQVKTAYELKLKQERPEAIEDMERHIILHAIDSRWQDYLRGMDELREGVGLRAYGQQDPLVEYKREAFGMFETLMTDIKLEVATQAFRYSTSAEAFRSFISSLPQAFIHDEISVLGSTGVARAAAEVAQAGGEEGAAAPEKPLVPIQRAEPKVGRNDPCPCGSGKKYKKCCGGK
jgi:preprotein translocase subunit SecA